ncbi:hypothetical protein FA13DRAFT_1736725 [Coprinellus micaceus]|uniref:Uncharacterized protein n=1 Tax=Coprinellus micaceus TaxID=71717 RepID=A0A4Y7SZR8_COPMI|nr:hypothetical protein FA13DRAFT_1736725 [Coprinellus micaceus]
MPTSPPQNDSPVGLDPPKQWCHSYFEGLRPAPHDIIYNRCRVDDWLIPETRPQSMPRCPLRYSTIA